MEREGGGGGGRREKRENCLNLIKDRTRSCSSITTAPATQLARVLVVLVRVYVKRRSAGREKGFEMWRKREREKERELSENCLGALSVKKGENEAFGL